MFKSICLSEAYLKDHRLRKDAQKQYELTQKNIHKIKQIALKMISYPEYQLAYDYVDNLFPRVKVKEISIYKVAAKDLAKMGYSGAEGFYDPVSKIIVACGARKLSQPVNKKYYITAKIERDEVIVHELCHYCYVFEGKRSLSSEIREEFAYGWSVGYLRQKGYSDEQIVRYNFLPYLVGLSYDEAIKNILVRNNISTYAYNNHSRYQRKEFERTYFGRIFDRAKEIAMERGLKLIDIYSKKIEEGTGLIDEEVDCDRFDILDL
jgi:hypothetical protein